MPIIVEIPDPFSSVVFRIDAQSAIKKCTEIFKKNGRSHKFCQHCERLRKLVAAKRETGFDFK